MVACGKAKDLGKQVRAIPCVKIQPSPPTSLCDSLAGGLTAPQALWSAAARRRFRRASLLAWYPLGYCLPAHGQQAGRAESGSPSADGPHSKAGSARKIRSWQTHSLGREGGPQPGALHREAGRASDRRRVMDAPGIQAASARKAGEAVPSTSRRPQERGSALPNTRCLLVLPLALAIAPTSYFASRLPRAALSPGVQSMLNQKRIERPGPAARGLPNRGEARTGSRL